MECHFLNQTDYTGGYLLVPDGFPKDPTTKAWVVVEVHGAGGLKPERRGEWLLDLFQDVPIIVLIPSFTDGYQAGDGAWAEQMLDHFKTLQDTYAVHDKLFLHGHSGGAQFVHRFAFHAPEVVAGVSAHSAGSWACDGGYGSISEKAKHIPFLISCGEDDTDYSVPKYPYTRIEWYHRFADALAEQGFVFHGSIWPGVGHGVEHSLYQDTFLECFHLATDGRVPIGSGWQGDVSALATQHP